MLVAAIKSLAFQKCTHIHTQYNVKWCGEILELWWLFLVQRQEARTSVLGEKSEGETEVQKEKRLQFYFQASWRLYSPFFLWFHEYSE